MSTSTSMPAMHHEIRRAPRAAKAAPEATSKGSWEGAPDRTSSWLWPMVMPATMGFMLAAMYVLHSMAHHAH